jgi:hypothetical protein
MKPKLLVKLPLAVLWATLLTVGLLVVILFVLLSAAAWLRDKVEDIGDAISEAELWIEDKWKGRRS